MGFVGKMGGGGGVVSGKVVGSTTGARWARRPPYGAALLALLLATSTAAQTVPSGQPITLQEVLTDTVGSEGWVRFRFVASEIRQDSDYEETGNDMTYLCEQTSLPYIAEYDLSADVIVISLANRETEFGVADPDVIQFFEAFRPVDGTCIWESL